MKIIGIIAAVCTTSAFLPQALKMIRTKATDGISLSMYIIFTLGILLWLAYGILSNDFPIILANSVTLILAATILYLKIRNG